MKFDELMDWLREIVSQEPPWSEAELAEWANEFLFAYDDEGMWDTIEEERRLQEQVIPQLKRHVRPYEHNPSLPALPTSPDGQLHGIGFIYDEDRDDRVLVAIDKFKNTPGVVALAEHEGVLEVYSRLPMDLTTINVCCDEWAVAIFVPYHGRWKELDGYFVRECVTQALGY